MHAGLLRGAGASVALLLLVVSGSLVAVALFEGDGSSYPALVGIGVLALGAAAVCLALALWGVIPLPRLTGLSLVFALSIAALVVWIGLSVLWSVAPDRSWEYANRGLVYLAFLVVGFVAGASNPPLRWVAAGGGVLSAAVVGWALAGKVVPNLFPDGGRVARLRDPLDYWNALALVAGIAILLGLWAATRREHRPWIRAASAVLVFASTVALLLTYSRGGAVVAAVIVAAFVLLVRERIQALATLVVAVPLAFLVSLWAFSVKGIAADHQPYDERLKAGLLLGLLLVAGGALVAVAARDLLRYEQTHADRIWRPTRRQASGAVAAAAVLAVVAVLVSSGGDPAAWASRSLDEFTNPASPQGANPSRFTSLSSSSRWEWWQESWRVFEHDPIQGSGAGSFFIARRPYRKSLIVVAEPHSLPIQFLGETGLVGLALLLAALGTGAAAVVQVVRRLNGAERAAGVALGLAALAYLIHTLIDYDWDFVALTGPILLVVGLLVASGRVAFEPRRRPMLVAGAASLAVVSVISLAAPWLAERKAEDAYRALDRQDANAARDAADEARSLNPLALEPLFAAAAVQEELDHRQQALELYVRAVEVQPENSDSWYQLARYEQSLGLRDAAIKHVGRAIRLDPKNEAIVQLIQELFAPSPQ